MRIVNVRGGEARGRFVGKEGSFMICVPRFWGGQKGSWVLGFLGAVYNHLIHLDR